MGWNKDGHTVKAEYLGSHIVSGVVTESRVKYGGKVQYTVKLDNPISLPGRVADILLIGEDDLITDFGVLPEDKMVVKSLMTGEPVVIDKDTPWCCNPASETFWSM